MELDEGQREEDERPVLEYQSAQPVADDRAKRWRLRRGPFIISIVLSAFLGLIAISMLFPASGRPKERALRVMCASNLRQIGQGIAVFRNDNRVWPQTLAEILMGGEVNAEVFACPSSDAEKAPGLTIQEAALTLIHPKHCSYIYFPPPADAGDLAIERVLAVERVENHRGGGMNILFGDGHVNWFDSQRAQFILSELNAGHNPPRTPATLPAGAVGAR